MNKRKLGSTPSFPDLTLHNPVHVVVVHGIPTSFDSADPQHLEMLRDMNPDTLDLMSLFVKWVGAHTVQHEATYLSIRIGVDTTDQGKLVVEQKIFYGCFNKRTEFRQQTKPRCMNLLYNSHIMRLFKEELMCPDCTDNHTDNMCTIPCKMTTNCTACARHIQA